MTSIATPLQLIPAIYTKLTNIDWGHHRTRLTVSTGVFVGYLLASLMFIAMVAMAIGRGITYLRRRLPDWLRALATQLDRLNAWLDEGDQPTKPTTSQPAAATLTTSTPPAGTPQKLPTRAPRRNRRRQHAPA